VLGDTFEVETFAYPGHQEKTVPRAKFDSDRGLAVSVATLIGDEEDNKRKVITHAAIPSAMAR
jgi:hypothetical protein